MKKSNKNKKRNRAKTVTLVMPDGKYKKVIYHLNKQITHGPATVKFVKDCELKVTTGMFGDEEACETDTFKRGSSFQVEIFGFYKNTINIQFGNGDCIFGLDKNLVEIFD